MRISFKVILIIWGILLVILGGLVYTAYSKLNPDALVSMMRQQVERSYPGAELRIGSVDYRFALDFKLKLKDIQFLRNSRKMGSIGEVEIKLPWWLFLTDSGSAQINIDRLDIQLDKLPTGERSSKATPAVADQKIKVKFQVPSYLSNAKYTLRAKDITIRDAQDSHRYFSLSKLLVREFQYGKTSVFEMTIPIEITHNTAKYNSELWLFGDLSPEETSWGINFRGDFKTRDVAENFQLEDLTIDGKARVLTDDLFVESSLNFLIDKQLVGTGVVNVSENTLNVALDFQKFPLNYLSIISEEMRNPYLPALEGYGQGKLSFKKKLSDGLSTLDSKVSFDGVMNLGADIIYAGKWNLSFDNSKWETSFITPNGEVSFFRRSLVDFSAGTLVQYNEELGFSGIELNKALTPIKTLSQFRSDKPGPYYTTTASIKNALHGDQQVNGDIKFGFSPDLRFYKSKLSTGEAFLDLSYQSKEGQEKIQIESKEFPLLAYSLFDPFLSATSGVLSGSLQGQWSGEWLKGEWKSQMEMEKLVEPKGVLIEMSNKLFSIFEVEKIPSDILIKAEVRNLTLDLKNLMYSNGEKLQLTGVLRPAPADSRLMLTNPGERKAKPIKKTINQFPF